MSIEVKQITVEQLLGETKKMFQDGYRLVTTTCVDEVENFRLIYHYDKETKLANLEVPVNKDQEIPSITGIYLCNFLAENEIQELFGVKIKDIAVDLKGRLYMTDDAQPTPMARTEKKKAKGGE
ncbi:MAG: NADH-quinone oxidoreductase subunit C [Syntrophomonas sp.]